MGQQQLQPSSAAAESNLGGARYVSRVHVDDISAALLASMQLGNRNGSGGVFNLADDEPATRAEVMAYAAELLDVPRKAAVEATLKGAGAAAAGRARARAVERKR